MLLQESPHLSKRHFVVLNLASVDAVSLLLVFSGFLTQLELQHEVIEVVGHQVFNLEATSLHSLSGKRRTAVQVLLVALV